MSHMCWAVALWKINIIYHQKCLDTGNTKSAQMSQLQKVQAIMAEGVIKSHSHLARKCCLKGYIIYII